MEVPTGHIAIEYSVGKLLDTYHQSGFLMLNPLSRYSVVETRVQTLALKNLSCGSKEGIILSFPNINIIFVLEETSVVSVIKKFGENYKATWVESKLAYE